MEKDRLYLGDCLKLMREIPDNSVDLICTDIPYNETDKREEGGLRKIHNGGADNAIFNLDDWLNEVWRICKGSFYIFCGFGQISQIHNFFLNHDTTTRLIVWEKTNPSPINGDFTCKKNEKLFARVKNISYLCIVKQIK